MDPKNSTEKTSTLSVGTNPPVEKMGPEIKYRIVVSGDRNWSDEKRVINVFSLISQSFPPVSTLVSHGDCRGADKIAAKVALEKGFHVKAYPADWSKYGKMAGPIRNSLMIKENKALGLHLVLIFHDNLDKSKGTKSLVAIAEKEGLKDIIFMCP